MRLPQWVKNGFILAALIFSQSYSDPSLCGQAALALLSFCLLSSGIYALNDVFDREADKAHPVKCQRPVAAGHVSVGQAMTLAIILLLCAIGNGAVLGSKFLLLLGTYAGINVVYSAGLKRVAILDVMVLAGGFVLRILAGAVAIGVRPSHWLLLCTLMVSLFLGFAKRRAEMVALDAGAAQTRQVLRHYSVAFLDQAIAMMTTATLVCYALYTVDTDTVAHFRTHSLLVTLLPVIYGLFRYLYLIYHRREGEDPTQTLWRDSPSLINLLVWIFLIFLIIEFRLVSGFFAT